MLPGGRFDPRAAAVDYVAKFKSDEMLLMAVGAVFRRFFARGQAGLQRGAGGLSRRRDRRRGAPNPRIEDPDGPCGTSSAPCSLSPSACSSTRQMLLKYALPIVVISVVVIVGKVVACTFGTFVAGNDCARRSSVGMGLAQIGEFSFIIASLGLSLKVTSDFLYPIAVAVSVLTTLLTPYLIKSSDGLVAWFDARAPKPLVDLSRILYELDRADRPPQDEPGGKIDPVNGTFQLVLNTALVQVDFPDRRHLFPGAVRLVSATCPSAEGAGMPSSGLADGFEPAVVHRHRRASWEGHGNVDRGFERQPEQCRSIRHPQRARGCGVYGFSWRHSLAMALLVILS